MSDINQATRPETNFVVHAAAGTGKTWLLTSRILRLLLAGALPGSILAITFTRKAAAEIEQRVMERLLEMASISPQTLQEKLTEIGCEPSGETVDAARQLYESLLVTDHPLRVTTFHAFCQDLLQHFPFESGLPPGFQIAENTQPLRDQAWQNFESNLRHPGNKACLASFETLLQLAGSPVAARSALNSFLDQRSDWWSFVEDEADASAYASNRFDQLLAASTMNGSFDTPSRDALRENIQRYSQLLDKHPTATMAKRAQQIDNNALESKNDFISLNKPNGVFRDSKDQRRIFAKNKTTLKNLGEKCLAEICELEVHIQQQLDDLLEQVKRQKNTMLNHAWFQCGQALLHEYQQLKEQMEMLDFADLEWQACRLLNKSDFSHWVQYKLDQRINHLLIDEFQDTNPTQWHLILPLLAEMAAGQPDRDRSAFIVGDIKQSIYRFRRAAPGLFDYASHWLAAHMNAASASQQKSYRSSPAIIEFVNLLFDQSAEDLPDHETDTGQRFDLPGFVRHETHYQQRWGAVELLPLVKRDKGETAKKDTAFRNPLQAARQHSNNTSEVQHRQEAELIITRIRNLIGQAIDENGTTRPLHAGDIMILVRSRAHTAIYETELRRAGIPFVSASKNQFLSALEIKDMINLLRALLRPYDNLALASALRSPIFSCSNQTLVALARLPQKWWWHRLQQLTIAANEHDPVHRAWRLLGKWRALVDRIPVHDLLDRIFEQANINNRYLTTAPAHVRPRIEANLNHLLVLALKMDSGRYPSLSQFVVSLPYLSEDDAPVASGESEKRLRLLTIHGAKGLEAPVVFLADAARADKDHAASYHTISHWPDDARKPETFLLTGKKIDRDMASSAAYDAERQADRREEANLLYVALTRARQYLFISGCEPRSKNHGWYGFIRSRLHERKQLLQDGMAHFKIQLHLDDDSTNSPLVFTFGQPKKMSKLAHSATAPSVIIDDALMQPVKNMAFRQIINPSHEKEEDDYVTHGNSDHADTARVRGIWLHRMLERLTDNADPATVKKKLWRESRHQLEDKLFESYWQQSLQLTGKNTLKLIFHPQNHGWTRNEMPILYRHNGKSVFGIIDRIIVDKDCVTVIDYKTHEMAATENIAKLAAQYYTQMRYYGDGVSKLWPGKKLKLLLLFTACAEVVEVPYPSDA